MPDGPLAYRKRGSPMSSASAKLVDFNRYRLARLIRDAGRQQGELARMMRAATVERSQLAEALNGAQRHLARIADSYKVLLVRLAQEKDFREACQAATELDDLDEMIRRRDELAKRLEDIRKESRTPLMVE
ncbi:hypothetical protein TSO221_06355 [Azospirillum sp. TSO22-1]|nr:hypothetical protein TSO221_06355 [Azospirillum sp. TSO22-1]